MNKIYILVKMLLKNGGGETNKKKGKMPSWISKILLTLIFVFCISLPLGGFISELYEALVQFNQQGLLISLGFSISTVIIFVFGILYVLTTFYFAKDIEMLLPLPLKSYEILTAKFITVLVYEYLTELLFLLPLLVVYGVKSSLGATYWALAVLVFLILPILPLALASILNMVIMRFTNLGKHKDAFRTIGGIFAMLIGIGINLLVQRSSNSAVTQEEMMSMLAEGNNSLVRVINSVFPTAKLGTYSLIGVSSKEMAFNIALFILVSMVSIAIFMVVAQKLYFKGVVGVSESFAKRKKLDRKEIEKSTTESSKLKAYTLKEIKVLLRTPAFLVNCVVGNFIWPIFLVFTMFMNNRQANSMNYVGSFLANQEIWGMVLGISFGIVLFIGGSNVIASTAISREGQSMYINKYIPMSYKEQIFAKLISAIVINMSSIVFLILIIIFAMKVPVVMAILIFVAALLANIISSGIGIIIDINRPKLNWDNEQKAVKQNMNAFISSIISLLMGGLSIFFFAMVKPSLIIAILAIVGAFLLIGGILLVYINTRGQKAYSKIE